MKLLCTLFLTGTLLALLCACGEQSDPAASVADPPSASPEQENPPSQSNEPLAQAEMEGPDLGLGEETTIIKDSTDGLPLLTAYITRPDVSGLVEGAAKKAIDRYYDDLYRSEKEWWTDGLVDFAKENKKAAADYGGDFLPFFVSETNQILYDGAAFLSIRRDLETYTGGAHGSHAVSCDNFRKSDGSLVTLAELFRTDNYKTILIEKIAEQIKALGADAEFYEDWEALLDRTFDENHFSIGGENLTIIYQEYDIAPYSAGAQCFSVSYAELSNQLNEPFLRNIYGGKE